MSKEICNSPRLARLTVFILGLMIVQSLLVGLGPFQATAAGPTTDNFEIMLTAPPVSMTSVAYTSDGKVIIAGAQGAIEKYDPTTGLFTELQTATSGAQTQAIGISPVGEILVASNLGEVVTFDTNYFKYVKTPAAVNTIHSVAWKPNGSYALLVGIQAMEKYLPSSSGPTLLTNAEVGNYTAYGIDSQTLACADWLPNGSYAIILSSTNRYYLFNDTNLTELTGGLTGVTWKSVSVSPDGYKALLVGSGGAVYLLNTSTLQLQGLTSGVTYDMWAADWLDNSTAIIMASDGSSHSYFYKFTGVATLTDVTPPSFAYGQQTYAMAFNRTLGGPVTGFAAGNIYCQYPNGAPSASNLELGAVGETEITIMMTSAPDKDFAYYEMYLGNHSGFTLNTDSKVANISTQATTIYTYTTLTRGTHYYMRIKTCDSYGLCTASNELDATTEDHTIVPAVHLWYTAVDYQSISLQWSNYTGAAFQKYEVYMGKVANFTAAPETMYTTITYLTTNTTYITELTQDTQFYFRVRVVNTYSYFNDSNEVAVKTKAISLVVDLSVKTVYINKVDLVWSKCIEPSFDKYEVHRSSTPSFTPSYQTLFTTLNSNSYNYSTVSDLTASTTYYFKIRTYSNTLMFNDSNEVSATTLAIQKPMAVTLSNEAPTYTSVSLKWTAYADVDFAKFEVYQDITPSFIATSDNKIQTDTNQYSTGYSVTGLTPNTQYYFMVRDFNTYNAYNDSNYVSVKTIFKPSPNPVTVKPCPEIDTTPCISWTVSDSLEFKKYEIHASIVSGFTPDATTLQSEDGIQGTGTGFYKSKYLYSLDPSWEGQPIYVKVRIIDTFNLFADSNQTIVTYDISPPAVHSVSAISINARGATIKWTEPYTQPADFARYEIYYKTSSTGKEHKLGSVTKFSTTTYKTSSLEPNTKYTFLVYVFDKAGNKSPASQSSYYTTKKDAVNEVFGAFNNEECICGGGFFAIVFFIAIISALAQKFKAKGVVWIIPLFICVLIVVFISAGNFLFDANVNTWFLPWLFITGIIASVITGLATLIVSAGSYSARGKAQFIVLAIFPVLIGLIIIYAITVYNYAPGVKRVSTSLFLPLFIACIVATVVIFAARVAYAKARSARWAREEAERQAQKRLDDYNTNKKATEERLNKLESRIGEHKTDAPPAMYSEAQKSIRSGWKAFEAATSVDEAASLDTAKTHLDNAEKVAVDIEAFLVGKQQARDNLASLKNKVDNLRAKKAPRIDNAINLFKDAQRKLDEADDLNEIKASVETITKANLACDESATSLKSAEDQLGDLKVQLSQVNSRLNEFRDHPKEKEATAQIAALVSGVMAIIQGQSDKPELDVLAKGREQIRQAQSIIQTADERERQRAGIASDIESLTAEVTEVSSWSTENVDEVSKAISKATAALERDDLTKGRDAIDLGFNRLEEIKSQSIPALTLVDKDYEIQVNKWEDLSVELRNNGNASAQDIDFEIDSPSAQLLDVKDKARTTYSIKPNDTTIVPVKIQFTAEGAVPTTIMINYKDAMEREYHEEIPLRVNVVPKMFMSQAQAPAKKITAEDYGLTIKKFGAINQGFYKFKVSIQNKGKFVAREVNFRLIFDNKTFRLHHIQPADLKLKGDSVDYGDIDPTTTRSCEFYLEAHMCTETKLDGTITFKDIEGKIQMMPIDTHAVTFVCPTFIDVSEISPAVVKELIADPAWKQDTRTFAVPSNLDLQFVFDSMKESIEKYDPNLKHVFDDCQNDPVSMESWYYGETEGATQGQGVKHIVIGKVTRMQRAGSTLLITGASMHQGQLFALSTKLGLAVSDGVTKAANLSRPIQQIFQTVEIKDSVLTGSTISMGGAGPGTATGDTTGKVSVKDSVMVRSDISGGKDVEVQGSVMQRTKVGPQQSTYQPGTCPPPDDAPPMKLVDPMREFQYNVYRDTLRQVYEDGVVTMDERAILKRLRGQLNITNDEHQTLEEEILAEFEAKKKPKQ